MCKFINIKSRKKINFDFSKAYLYIFFWLKFEILLRGFFVNLLILLEIVKDILSIIEKRLVAVLEADLGIKISLKCLT